VQKLSGGINYADILILLAYAPWRDMSEKVRSAFKSFYLLLLARWVPQHLFFGFKPVNKLEHNLLVRALSSGQIMTAPNGFAVIRSVTFFCRGESAPGVLLTL